MGSDGDNKQLAIAELRDIMIPLRDYPHLPVWATVRESIELMQSAQLDVRRKRSLPRSILLFDLDGSLSGMVRRRDIMRGLEPAFLVSQPLEKRILFFDVGVDPNLSELSGEHLVEGIREQANRPIAEVMRPLERSIDINEHFIKAVYEMVSANLNILPIKENGVVVGVARSVDLFHELARIALGSE